MNRVMNRNTNIVNNHEVARAMAAASQAKVKRKNKPTGSAPTPARPKKTTSVPTARKGARAPIATTPRQDLQTKFYEANGLRIPLYDQDGTGNKRKQHTRLAKSLLHKNLEQLLDIVEQYAGTAKRRELKDKGLSKVKVATWIEEKETLALGRHPKSALPSTSTAHSVAQTNNTVATSYALVAPIANSRIRKPFKASPLSSTEASASHAAVANKDAHGQPGSRKKRAHDDTHGQPRKKIQKCNTGETVVAVTHDHRTKVVREGRPGNEIVPISPHTSGQSTNGKGPRHVGVSKVRPDHGTGIDTPEPDQPTVVVRDDSKNRVVITKTPSHTGTVYFIDTAAARSENVPSSLPPAPFLKEGRHGRQGDFVYDPDLCTGLGHQIVPDDQYMWNKFIGFNSMFSHKLLHSHFVDKEISAWRESKDAWDKWQMWYSGFVEKYPGYAVAHLWPCGCEKVSEDGESEEE